MKYLAILLMFVGGFLSAQNTFEVVELRGLPGSYVKDTITLGADYLKYGVENDSGTVIFVGEEFQRIQLQDTIEAVQAMLAGTTLLFTDTITGNQNIVNTDFIFRVDDNIYGTATINSIGYHKTWRTTEDYDTITGRLYNNGDVVIVNDIILDETNNVRIIVGSGTPESNVTAGIGSIFVRTDGSTGTTMYVKEAGTGNTGWAAM